MAKENKKTVLSVLLFLLVFGGLWTIATFYDLQISQLVTKNIFNETGFLTDSWFGNLFETVGMFPAYFGSATVCVILFYFFGKCKLKLPVRIIGAVCCYAVGVYYLQGAFRDVFKYPFNHLLVDTGETANTLTAVEYFLSALTFSMYLLIVRKVPFAVWKRLLWFAVAYSCMAFVAGESVSLVKDAVQRVRYRTLFWGVQNGVGTSVSDYYTAWYQVSSFKEIFANTPVSGYADWKNSFPSSHTASAGFSYAVIMLINALDIHKKSQKILLWTVPIVWTGLTAFARILVGAHFLSDVLIGGTFSFVSMILVREIFLCRFSHVKNLLQNKKLLETERKTACPDLSSESETVIKIKL